MLLFDALALQQKFSKMCKHIAILYIFLLAVDCEETILKSQDHFGNKGTWHEMARCANGSYAYAFQLKSDKDSAAGMLYDGTGVNSVYLYCSKANVSNRDGIKLVGGDGLWGTVDKVHECEPGEWLLGFTIMVPKKGDEFNDDPGIINFNMVCTDGKHLIGDAKEIVAQYTKRLFRSQPIMCDPLHVICGVASQIHPDQGSGGDDHSLTNVKMACCPGPYNFGDQDTIVEGP